MQQLKNQLLKLLDESKKTLIITHEYPDRDAIGSMVSLYWILKDMGYDNIDMLNETKNEIREGFLEGMEKIIQGKLEDYIENYDLLIIVDQSTWEQVSSSDQNITKEKKVVIIDHHSSKTNIEHVLKIKKIVPANTQLIYELFKDDVKLDEKIAKPILTGLYDDTGGFRYPSVSTETMQLAGELIRIIPISEIAEEANEMNKKIFEAGREVLDHSGFDDEGKYYYSYIPKELIEKYKLTYSDISNIKDKFIQILTSIKGYDWGFMVKPGREGICTVSFRSKADTVNIRKIAGIFGGGGHVNSSGAKIEISEPKKCTGFIRNELKKKFNDR